MTKEKSAASGRLGQVALPGLAHEILAAGMMRLLGGELEARLLVDAARGMKDVVGPERHALIAGEAREAQALLHQAPADAEAPRLGLHQQQAQLRDLVALAHNHDRAQDLA